MVTGLVRESSREWFFGNLALERTEAIHRLDDCRSAGVQGVSGGQEIGSRRRVVGNEAIADHLLELSGRIKSALRHSYWLQIQACRTVIR